MLKKILELKGTIELSREEKQKIKGGIACGEGFPPCIAGFHCVLQPVTGYCKQN